MDLEGLTAWVPGRKDGYESLRAALGGHPEEEESRGSRSESLA
jgi:hypothetical protein